MEAELEEIDLNDYADPPATAMGGATPIFGRVSGRRRAPKQYKLPEDTPEDKAFYDSLRNKTSPTTAPAITPPVSPATPPQTPQDVAGDQQYIQAAVQSQPPDTFIKGDRGRIERARTIAATLDIPFSEAYDGEAVYTKSMEAKAPDLFKEAGKSFMRGIGGAYINAGRAMELVGAGDAAQTYVGFGRYLTDAYLPSVKAKDFTFDRLVDPEWWATSVTESVPSMLALLPAAIVGGYAAAGAGGAVGLGLFGKTVLGALGGAALSRPVESAFEAAQSYEEALQKGVMESDARRQAGEVFKGNMALTGLDAAQFALAFTPLRFLGKYAPKALAARIAAGTAKLALVAASEGGEEAYQTAVQQRARGEIVSWNPEMKESAAVGALFGLGLGGAGSVFEALTDRIQSRMPNNLAETYQVAEQVALARGIDPVAAKVEALDAVAGEAQGKAHIEKVIGDLVNIAEGKEVQPLTVEDMDADIEKFAKEPAFTMEQQAEPEALDITSDEALDSIIAGDTSIEEMLGVEPDLQEIPTQANNLTMPQTGGPGQESTETQTPKPEGGILEHNEKMLDAAYAKKPEAQGVYFHGSEFGSLDVSAEGGNFGGAIFLTDDPNFALSYSKQNPQEVYSFKVSSGAKLLDLDNNGQLEKFVNALIADDDFRNELMREDLAGGEDEFRESLFKSLKNQDFQEHTDFESDIFRRVATELGYDGTESRGELVIWNHDILENTFRPNSSSPQGSGQKFLISEETYQSALASLKEKTTGFHAGIDPTVLGDLVKIGAYHIERGIAKFAEWSKAMIERFGEGIQPHLEEIFEQSNSMVKRGVKSGMAEPMEGAESAEGATMPARDVKKQIRKVTGQENLAKLIREDVALRAGMKKAEQAARIAFREGGKEAQTKAKADLRDILIKAKLKAEQFGFREGFKVAEKLTRKDLTQAFQDEQATIEETRKALVEIIQESLPPEMRGKFLDPIIKKLTERKQNDILDRVAAMKDKLTKDELIDELASLKKMNGSINVEYQKRISALLGDIQTKTITPQTRANVQGLIEFSEREQMPSGVSGKTLALIDRLQGRQAADMSIDELKELTALARHLTELGKLKQKLKYKYNERERQKALATLLSTTKNIDPKLSGRDTQTDAIKKGSLYIYSETLQAPRVAEMMDGFKAGENGKLVRRLAQAELNAQWQIRTTIDSAVKEALEAGIGTLSEEQEVKLMINIRNREGADAATLSLMKKYGYQEIPRLTVPEERLIGILKKYSSDMFGDQVAAMFEEMTNVPFPRMENRILPLKYEGEPKLAPEEVILHTPHKMTQTEKGFTIARQPGVKKTPRVDVWGVFEQGINEQLWFLHMQPELNDAAHLVKTKQFIDKAGEIGSNWWRDHLDIIARRGWSATAQHNAFSNMLKAARGNISTAILGYRLSSILMQPFAVFDAMAYAQSQYGSNAARKVLAEVGKSWIVPGIANEYVDADITHALPLRRGGEVAIEEALTKAGRQGGVKSAFIRGGLSLISKADLRTAAGVQKAFERILTDAGATAPAREAAILMDLSQGASDVTFRPHILARGEGARTWFTFQSFMLNRWGLMAHDMIGKGLIKGQGRGRMAALIGLGILVGGKLAEDQAREYLYQMIKNRKLPQRSILQDVFMALPSNIPVFGSAFEAVSSRGGADIPASRVVYDILKTSQIPFQKTGEQRGKTALRGASAAASLVGGVPGTSQAFDLIEGALFPEKPKGNSRIKPASMKPKKSD